MHKKLPFSPMPYMQWGLALYFAIGTLSLTGYSRHARAETLSSVERTLSNFIKNQRFDEALQVAQRYLALTKARYGDDSLQYARATAKVADAQFGSGHPAEAESSRRSAIAILEKRLGPNDAQVAAILTELASTVQAQGRAPEVAPLLERALRITERAFGSGSEEVAGAVDNLAGFYLGQGELSEADRLYRRSLRIREKANGPRDVSVGASLQGLASVFERQSKPAEAEAAYKRTIAIYEEENGTSDVSVAYVLNSLAELYRNQRQFNESARAYERSLRVFEKRYGADRTTAASIVSVTSSNLASVYTLIGRHADAERLLRRALAMDEQIFGNDAPVVAERLHALADILASDGRYTDAEPLVRRALASRERTFGPSHALVGASLLSLATLKGNRGHWLEAEPDLERALNIYEGALGSNHPDTVATRQVLAAIRLLRGGTSLAAGFSEVMRTLWEQLAHLGNDNPLAIKAKDLLGQALVFEGRFDEAEHLLREALIARRKVSGPEASETAECMTHLAFLYNYRNRHAESETLLKEAIAIQEKTLGIDHLGVAETIETLAWVYHGEGRYELATPLLRRVLSVREGTLGAEHYLTARSMNSLAINYTHRRAYIEAEQLYKRAISVEEVVFGHSNVFSATSYDNLGWLYRVQHRYPEAEVFLKKALALKEKAMGPESAEAADTLNGLGQVYDDWGKFDLAEPALLRALSIREKRFGQDDATTSMTLNNLGWHYLRARNWGRALEAYERSTQVLLRRRWRNGSSQFGRTTDDANGEVAHNHYRFRNQAVAAYWVSQAMPGQAEELGMKSFELAQWAALSDTSQTVAAMSARLAAGTGELAAVVREYQDLERDGRALDTLLVGLLSKPRAERNAENEKKLRARLGQIEERLAESRHSIAQRFPAYSALASADAISIPDTQALLNDDEVMIQFLFSTEESFVWVVGKHDTRWLRIPWGEANIENSVVALRCGLDWNEWRDNVRGERCEQLVKPGWRGQDPPFDLSIAFGLYDMLLRPFEDLTEGKQILVVPSGPVTSIPFHALVTVRPNESLPQEPSGYRKAAWLSKRNAITILPSVSALKGLRGARGKAGSMTFVGFGNPLLDGNPKRSSDVRRAREARDKQQCAQKAPTLALATDERGIDHDVDWLRGGLTNTAALRVQPPLPETADELCSVARSLGAASSQVYLGAQATERNVKSLSATGVLEKARIVHFATHGLLGHETRLFAATIEPALLLTPPMSASEDDDGLLTASEITQLKLNADWVVLSACNTAGGVGKGNMDGLSGLSRAFFYAGARALLVSHWYVDSDATVMLISTAVAEMQSDPKVGRSEALRRSMLALIARDERTAHPAYWAPFVVVGEGAGEAR